jgi:hypothetical protein
MMALYISRKKDSFTRKLDALPVRECGMSILIKNQKVLVV